MLTEYVQETEDYFESCFKFVDKINKFSVKLFYDCGNSKSGRYNGMFDIYVEDWKVKSFKGFNECKIDNYGVYRWLTRRQRNFVSRVLGV